MEANEYINSLLKPVKKAGAVYREVELPPAAKGGATPRGGLRAQTLCNPLWKPYLFQRIAMVLQNIFR